MTAALTSTAPRRLSVVRRQDGLVVADANWYTTANLFAEAARPGLATLLLTCHDYYNAWRDGRNPASWSTPLEERTPGSWARNLVLPSGWMKRFPRLGMRPIRTAVRRWREAARIDGPTTLVLTYPHYLHLRDLLAPDRHVYFNIDDYTQYWPSRARTLERLEQRAVRESDLTICVSNHRAEHLRRSVPDSADRIHHLPHGTPAAFLADAPHHEPAAAPPDLATLPRPYLGFVGTLEDRIDWPLLDRLAQSFPRASIILIGRPLPRGRAPWQAEARSVLRRPNVHLLGWRPQSSLAAYIAAFDVCLIPYRADHPFNIACCPTKIMDYMGSGRPIVSTDLPECRLYTELFNVEADHGSFVAATRSILHANSDDGCAADRHAWAADHTCARTVERLLGLLGD